MNFSIIFNTCIKQQTRKRMLSPSYRYGILSYLSFYITISNLGAKVSKIIIALSASTGEPSVFAMGFIGIPLSRPLLATHSHI